jgi:hypothetical protein
MSCTLSLTESGCQLQMLDISKDILVGRPYRGTAVLYRINILLNANTVVDSDESRIAGICVGVSIRLMANANIECLYAYQ